MSLTAQKIFARTPHGDWRIAAIGCTAEVPDCEGMEYIQVLIECEPHPVTSRELKNGIEPGSPTAESYTNAMVRGGLWYSGDFDRKNPEHVYSGSGAGMQSYYDGGADAATGERGDLERKDGSGVLPSEFSGGAFNTHQMDDRAAEDNPQKEWRYIQRSEGLTGAFGKKRHDPDQEDTTEDATDKHVVAMAKHQKQIAERELAAITLESDRPTPRVIELKAIIAQCNSLLAAVNRRGKLRTRSRQQNVNDSVRKNIDNAIATIARENIKLGGYFRSCIRRPAWVLDDRGKSGWLFRDEDRVPWDLKPIPLTEGEADAVMEKTESGWYLRWADDAGLEIEDDLKGLDYIARILRNGEAGIPCCLLRQTEIAKSLLLPRFTIFASYSSGGIDAFGKDDDGTRDQALESSRTQVIKPNSLLARHGIQPGLFKLNMESISRLWRRMVYRRAEAYTDKGRSEDYRELKMVVNQIQAGINYIKRRFSTISDIGRMNEHDYSSVSHAVGTAIDVIAAKLPEMGEYLRAHIKRGRVCWHESGEVLWYVRGIGPFPRVQSIAEDALYLKAKGELVSCEWASEICAFGALAYRKDADGSIESVLGRTQYGNHEDEEKVFVVNKTT